MLKDKRSTHPFDPNTDEAKVAHLLIDALYKHGALPSIEDLKKTGEWHAIVLAIADEAKRDGLMGARTAYHAMLDRKPEGDYLIRLSTAENAKERAKKQKGTDEDADLDAQGLMRTPSGVIVCRTLDEDAIDKLPDTQYLVNKVIMEASVSMPVGDANAGKTFLMLGMAGAVARGQQWMGRATQQGLVLYVYAEGLKGSRNRLQGLRQHHGWDKTPNFQIIRHPLHFTADRDLIFDTVGYYSKLYEDQYGMPFKMMIFDPFSSNAADINQSDQREVHNVLRVCHDLVAKFGCHVSLPHHTNKGGEFNGSQAFKNHVDTMIGVTVDSRTNATIITCLKQRDDERFKDIILERKRITLDPDSNGNPITTCVFIPHPDTNTILNDTLEEAMLDILLRADQQILNDTEWRKLTQETRPTSRGDFTKARDHLKAQHAITELSRGACNARRFTVSLLSAKRKKEEVLNESEEDNLSCM